jgi:DNA-binding XRE family transcriptional regulator
VPTPTLSPVAVARFIRDLTQAELADRAGLNRDTIGRIERGELPTLRTAIAIADALDVDVADILPHNENDAPHQTRRSKVSVTAAHGTG